MTEEINYVLSYASPFSLFDQNKAHKFHTVLPICAMISYARNVACCYKIPCYKIGIQL